jgi:hypothetical protein
VNFKQYFLREDLELSPSEKKSTKMGLNTGTEHHKTLQGAFGLNLKKKKPYTIGKSHTRRKQHHDMVARCLSSKKNLPLLLGQAQEIMDFYGLCPTPEEPVKSIKQTEAHLQMMRPDVYILIFKEKENGAT